MFLKIYDRDARSPWAIAPAAAELAIWNAVHVRLAGGVPNPMAARVAGWLVGPVDDALDSPRRLIFGAIDREAP